MYVKLFNQIFHSSVAEDYQVRHMFSDLLVLADSDGIVDMTMDSIQGITKVPADIIKRTMDVLMKPDPESRSQIEDGRRIVLLDTHRSWGWQIVNYALYRNFKDADTKKKYWRDQKRKQRGSPQLSSNVLDCPHPSSHTEADTEEEAKAVKEEKLVSLAKKERAKAAKTPSNIMEAKSYGVEIGLPPDDVDAWWDHFSTNGWKVGRAPGTAMKDWKAALRNWKRNKKYGVGPAAAPQNGRSQPFKPIMTFSAMKDQRALLAVEIEKIRSMEPRQEGGLTDAQNLTIQGHISKRKEIYEAMKTA